MTKGTGLSISSLKLSQDDKSVKSKQRDNSKVKNTSVSIEELHRHFKLNFSGFDSFLLDENFDSSKDNSLQVKATDIACPKKRKHVIDNVNDENISAKKLKKVGRKKPNAKEDIEVSNECVISKNENIFTANTKSLKPRKNLGCLPENQSSIGVFNNDISPKESMLKNKEPQEIITTEIEKCSDVPKNLIKNSNDLNEKQNKSKRSSRNRNGSNSETDGVNDVNFRIYSPSKQDTLMNTDSSLCKKDLQTKTEDIDDDIINIVNKKVASKKKRKCLLNLLDDLKNLTDNVDSCNEEESKSKRSENGTKPNSKTENAKEKGVDSSTCLKGNTLANKDFECDKKNRNVFEVETPSSSHENFVLPVKKKDKIINDSNILINNKMSKSQNKMNAKKSGKLSDNEVCSTTKLGMKADNVHSTYNAEDKSVKKNVKNVSEYLDLNSKHIKGNNKKSKSVNYPSKVKEKKIKTKTKLLDDSIEKFIISNILNDAELMQSKCEKNKISSKVTHKKEKCKLQEEGILVNSEKVNNQNLVSKKLHAKIDKNKKSIETSSNLKNNSDKSDHSSDASEISTINQVNKKSEHAEVNKVFDKDNDEKLMLTSKNVVSHKLKNQKVDDSKISFKIEIALEKLQSSIHTDEHNEIEKNDVKGTLFENNKSEPSSNEIENKFNFNNSSDAFVISREFNENAKSTTSDGNLSENSETRRSKSSMKKLKKLSLQLKDTAVIDPESVHTNVSEELSVLQGSKKKKKSKQMDVNSDETLTDKSKSPCNGVFDVRIDEPNNVEQSDKQLLSFANSEEVTIENSKVSCATSSKSYNILEKTEVNENNSQKISPINILSVENVQLSTYILKYDEPEETDANDELSKLTSTSHKKKGKNMLQSEDDTAAESISSLDDVPTKCRTLKGRKKKFKEIVTNLEESFKGNSNKLNNSLDTFNVFTGNKVSDKLTPSNVDGNLCEITKIKELKTPFERSTKLSLPSEENVYNSELINANASEEFGTLENKKEKKREINLNKNETKVSPRKEQKLLLSGENVDCEIQHSCITNDDVSVKVNALQNIQKFDVIENSDKPLKNKMKKIDKFSDVDFELTNTSEEIDTLTNKKEEKEVVHLNKNYIEHNVTKTSLKKTKKCSLKSRKNSDSERTNDSCVSGEDNVLQSKEKDKGVIRNVDKNHNNEAEKLHKIFDGVGEFNVVEDDDKSKNTEQNVESENLESSVLNQKCHESHQNDMNNKSSIQLKVYKSRKRQLQQPEDTIDNKSPNDSDTYKRAKILQGKQKKEQSKNCIENVDKDLTDEMQSLDKSCEEKIDVIDKQRTRESNEKRLSISQEVLTENSKISCPKFSKYLDDLRNTEVDASKTKNLSPKTVLPSESSTFSSLVQKHNKFEHRDVTEKDSQSRTPHKKGRTNLLQLKDDVALEEFHTSQNCKEKSKQTFNILEGNVTDDSYTIRNSSIDFDTFGDYVANNRSTISNVDDSIKTSEAKQSRASPRKENQLPVQFEKNANSSNDNNVSNKTKYAKQQSDKKLLSIAKEMVTEESKKNIVTSEFLNILKKSEAEENKINKVTSDTLSLLENFVSAELIRKYIEIEPSSVCENFSTQSDKDIVNFETGSNCKVSEKLHESQNEKMPREVVTTSNVTFVDRYNEMRTCAGFDVHNQDDIGEHTPDDMCKNKMSFSTEEMSTEVNGSKNNCPTPFESPNHSSNNVNTKEPEKAIQSILEQKENSTTSYDDLSNVLDIPGMIKCDNLLKTSERKQSSTLDGQTEKDTEIHLRDVLIMGSDQTTEKKKSEEFIKNTKDECGKENEYNCSWVTCRKEIAEIIASHLKKFHAGNLNCEPEAFRQHIDTQRNDEVTVVKVDIMHCTEKEYTKVISKKQIKVPNKTITKRSSDFEPANFENISTSLKSDGNQYQQYKKPHCSSYIFKYDCNGSVTINQSVNDNHTDCGKDELHALRSNFEHLSNTQLICTQTKKSCSPVDNIDYNTMDSHKGWFIAPSQSSKERTCEGEISNVHDQDVSGLLEDNRECPEQRSCQNKSNKSIDEIESLFDNNCNMPNERVMCNSDDKTKYGKAKDVNVSTKVPHNVSFKSEHVCVEDNICNSDDRNVHNNEIEIKELKNQRKNFNSEQISDVETIYDSDNHKECDKSLNCGSRRQVSLSLTSKGCRKRSSASDNSLYNDDLIIKRKMLKLTNETVCTRNSLEEQPVEKNVCHEVLSQSALIDSGGKESTKRAWKSDVHIPVRSGSRKSNSNNTSPKYVINTKRSTIRDLKNVKRSINDDKNRKGSSEEYSKVLSTVSSKRKCSESNEVLQRIEENKNNKQISKINKYSKSADSAINSDTSSTENVSKKYADKDIDDIILYIVSNLSKESNKVKESKSHYPSNIDSSKGDTSNNEVTAEIDNLFSEENNSITKKIRKGSQSLTENSTADKTKFSNKNNRKGQKNRKSNLGDNLNIANENRGKGSFDGRNVLTEESHVSKQLKNSNMDAEKCVNKDEVHKPDECIPSNKGAKKSCDIKTYKLKSRGEVETITESDKTCGNHSQMLVNDFHRSDDEAIAIKDNSSNMECDIIDHLQEKDDEIDLKANHNNSKGTNVGHKNLNEDGNGNHEDKDLAALVIKSGICSPKNKFECSRSLDKVSRRASTCSSTTSLDNIQVLENNLICTPRKSSSEDVEQNYSLTKGDSSWGKKKRSIRGSTSTTAFDNMLRSEASSKCSSSNLLRNSRLLKSTSSSKKYKRIRKESDFTTESENDESDKRNKFKMKYFVKSRYGKNYSKKTQPKFDLIEKSICVKSCSPSIDEDSDNMSKVMCIKKNTLNEQLKIMDDNLNDDSDTYRKQQKHIQAVQVNISNDDGSSADERIINKNQNNSTERQKSKTKKCDILIKKSKSNIPRKKICTSTPKYSTLEKVLSSSKFNKKISKLLYKTLVGQNVSSGNKTSEKSYDDFIQMRYGISQDDNETPSVSRIEVEKPEFNTDKVKIIKVERFWHGKRQNKESPTADTQEPGVMTVSKHDGEKDRIKGKNRKFKKRVGNRNRSKSDQRRKDGLHCPEDKNSMSGYDQEESSTSTEYNTNKSNKKDHKSQSFMYSNNNINSSSENEHQSKEDIAKVSEYF